MAVFQGKVSHVELLWAMAGLIRAGGVALMDLWDAAEVERKGLGVYAVGQVRVKRGMEELYEYYI